MLLYLLSKPLSCRLERCDCAEANLGVEMLDQAGVEGALNDGSRVDEVLILSDQLDRVS